MAKKTTTKRFFKLGKAAASYTHGNSVLNIRGKEIVSIDKSLILPGDKHLANALTSGHIIELQENEIPKGTSITELPLPELVKKPKKIKIQISGKDEDYELDNDDEDNDDEDNDDEDNDDEDNDDEDNDDEDNDDEENEDEDEEEEKEEEKPKKGRGRKKIG